MKHIITYLSTYLTELLQNPKTLWCTETPSGDFQSYGICELFSVFITLVSSKLWIIVVSNCGSAFYWEYEFWVVLSVLKDINKSRITGQYPYQMFLTGNKGYRWKDKIQMPLWRITFIILVSLSLSLSLSLCTCAYSSRTISNTGLKILPDFSKINSAALEFLL